MALKSVKKLMLKDYLMISGVTKMQNLGDLKQNFSSIVTFEIKFFRTFVK
jgi:hypothetical protein